jgi:hypothetical protein
MYDELYEGLNQISSLNTGDGGDVTTVVEDGYVQAPVTETEVVDGETRTVYINSVEADYWLAQNPDYVGYIYIDGLGLTTL